MGIEGEIIMVGIAGGTSPRTKGAKILWWIAFSISAAFVLYVLAKNLL
jgi:hypothetical protein